MKVFFKSRYTHNIENYIKVVNNTAISTNFNVKVIQHRVNLDNGLYDSKTLSKVDNEEVNERFANVTLEPTENITSVILTKKELKSLYDHTSQDETRRHLQGIYVTKGELVATNGVTLRLLKFPKLKAKNSTIINRELIKMILPYFKKNDTIELKVSENLTHISVGDFTFIGTNITRDYVKYDFIIPKKSNGTFKVTSKLPKLELDRLNRVTVKIEDKIVFVNDLAIGQSDSENIVFGFNYKLFKKLVENSNEVSLINEFSPFCAYDGSNVTIAMPMKL